MGRGREGEEGTRERGKGGKGEGWGKDAAECKEGRRGGTMEGRGIKERIMEVGL